MGKGSGPQGLQPQWSHDHDHPLQVNLSCTLCSIFLGCRGASQGSACVMRWLDFFFVFVGMSKRGAHKGNSQRIAALVPMRNTLRRVMS